MDALQNWHKGRDKWRFNTGNSVRIISTGEIGTVKCGGTDNDVPVYCLEVPSSKVWITVKEHEVESALKK